jgi:hypothetical protein
MRIQTSLPNTLARSDSRPPNRTKRQPGPPPADSALYLSMRRLREVAPDPKNQFPRTNRNQFMNYPECKLTSRKDRVLTRREDLTQESLMELLDYNPETGIFTWKNPTRYHLRLTGKPAGQISHGYLLIQIHGLKYKAHRLAWLYIYSEWPLIVDHINRNPSDNRIKNLRRCTQSENIRNHSKKQNKSGLPVGVRKAASGRFHARITFEKRQIALGSFETFEDASFAYLKARTEMFGEFAPI